MEGMKAKGGQVNGYRGAGRGQHHAVGMEVLEGGTEKNSEATELWVCAES